MKKKELRRIIAKLTVNDLLAGNVFDLTNQVNTLVTQSAHLERALPNIIKVLTEYKLPPVVEEKRGLCRTFASGKTLVDPHATVTQEQILQRNKVKLKELRPEEIDERGE